MKIRNLTQKLTLKKETISNLNTIRGRGEGARKKVRSSEALKKKGMWWYFNCPELA